MSAAIMVGRSVFVFFAFVNLSPFGLDAVSAAMMVGRSVFVCFCLRQLVAFWIWCGAGMETSESRQTCCDVVAKHAWCS